MLFVYISLDSFMDAIINILPKVFTSFMIPYLKMLALVMVMVFT